LRASRQVPVQLYQDGRRRNSVDKGIEFRIAKV